jgi:hypothetical protein
LPEPLSGGIQPDPARSMNRKPRYRAAARAALRAQGIKAAYNCKIWHVTVSKAIPLPEWVKNKFPGLSGGERYVWLDPSQGARLARFDRSLGGQPEVIITTFRYCEQCGRPLIGEEADNRRRLVGTSAEARLAPCGENCDRDKKSRIWINLAPGTQAARAWRAA